MVVVQLNCGHFRYHRSTVRIQSSVCGKDEDKEKSGREWSIKNVGSKWHMTGCDPRISGVGSDRSTN